MTHDANPPGAPPPQANQPPGAFAPESPPTVIPLPGSTTAPPAKPSAKTSAKPAVPHDSFREFIETIVFVVVLVLILKTFLAEAFVIPTGSMATTLLGYHGEVTCEQCGYRFLVNKSKEADPAERRPDPVVDCTCPNCQYVNEMRPRFRPGG